MNSSKGSRGPVVPTGSFPWDSNKFENDGPSKYQYARPMAYLTEKMGMGDPSTGTGIDADGNFNFNGTDFETPRQLPWDGDAAYTPNKHTNGGRQGK